jgi:hypothetical protein
MRQAQGLRGAGERGIVLVLALLVMVILSILGITLLTLAGTEHTVATNEFFSEGALSAAEAGIDRGLNQLSANPTTSVVAYPTSGTQIDLAATRFSYRSGPRTPDAPAPLTYVGSRTEPGYSIAVGTGYNPSGYSFHTYEFSATGSGPRNAQREIQVRAEYGPVAQ